MNRLNQGIRGYRGLHLGHVQKHWSAKSLDVIIQRVLLICCSPCSGFAMKKIFNFISTFVRLVECCHFVFWDWRIYKIKEWLPKQLYWSSNNIWRFWLITVKIHESKTNTNAKDLWLLLLVIFGSNSIKYLFERFFYKLKWSKRLCEQNAASSFIWVLGTLQLVRSIQPDWHAKAGCLAGFSWY